MTEKEFLTEFAKRYETLNLNYDINDNTRETFIDQFLKQIHHKYYEVEFISKEKELSFGGIPVKFDESTLNPTLILTDGEGKAIGELTEGVHTLYNQEGKVIGWSNLTQEELRKLYKDNS